MSMNRLVCRNRV